jgi:hypothetical protein
MVPSFFIIPEEIPTETNIALPVVLLIEIKSAPPTCDKLKATIKFLFFPFGLVGVGSSISTILNSLLTFVPLNRFVNFFIFNSISIQTGTVGYLDKTQLRVILSFSPAKPVDENITENVSARRMVRDFITYLTFFPFL